MRWSGPGITGSSWFDFAIVLAAAASFAYLLGWLSLRFDHEDRTDYRR